MPGLQELLRKKKSSERLTNGDKEENFKGSADGPPTEKKARPISKRVTGVPLRGSGLPEDQLSGT